MLGFLLQLTAVDGIEYLSPISPFNSHYVGIPSATKDMVVEAIQEAQTFNSHYVGISSATLAANWGGYCNLMPFQFPLCWDFLCNITRLREQAKKLKLNFQFPLCWDFLCNP